MKWLRQGMAQAVIWPTHLPSCLGVPMWLYTHWTVYATQEGAPWNQNQGVMAAGQAVGWGWGSKVQKQVEMIYKLFCTLQAPTATKGS